MELLNVEQLRKILKEYGVSHSGLRKDLVLRLRNFLVEKNFDIDDFCLTKYEEFRSNKMQDKNELGCRPKTRFQTNKPVNIDADWDVSPKDSASNISNKTYISRTSTVKSAIKQQRILEEANLAGLAAKMKVLEEMQKNELEKVKLQQRKEALELTAKMEEANAKTQVLQKFEETSSDVEKESRLTSKISRSNSKGEKQCCRRKEPKQESTNSSGEDKNASNNELLKNLVMFNMKSLMPRNDIQKFCGEYTEYKTFIRAFDNVISSKLVDDDEKIYYLSQYTTDKPLEIVKACMNMAPDEGYRTARLMLDKRYGNTEKIVSSYINKILDWPIIRNDDVENLDEFSILLRNCKNAICGVRGSVEVDHPKTMREIMKKLPYSLQDKWRRKVDYIYEIQDNVVSFSDLVDFIEVESRIANNPLFGRNLFNEKSKDLNKTDKVQGKFKVNAINLDNIKCWFCKEKHFIDECQNLSKLQYEERTKIIKEMELCFSCLRKGHFSKNCRSRKQCETCQGTHPTILHRVKENIAQDESDDPINMSNKTETVHVESNSINAETNFKLNILPVSIKYCDKIIKTYAFLDPGSTTSFCSLSLSKKLGISCNSRNKVNLSVTTIQASNKPMESFVIKDLSISPANDPGVTVKLPPLFALSSIPASHDDIVSKKEIINLKYLKDIPIPTVDSEIELLIGNNVPAIMEPWEIINSPIRGGPYAMKTIMGWLVCGIKCASKISHNVSRISINNEELKQILLDMYNREFEDLNFTSDEYSVQERHWLNFVEENCKLLDNNHYEIALPFKKNLPEIPNTIPTALRRLELLKRKMQTNEDFRLEYTKFMNDVIHNGHAEEAENDNDIGRTWFIPHFGVYHPQKKKVRVVYDCAAKVKGLSLNDLLDQGPSLTNTIVNVLTRFRLGKYALCADISKMFYQVLVPSKDRDYLSSFWWIDGDFNSRPVRFRMRVHLFGACSSPSVATFALQKTARDNDQVFHRDIVNSVLQQFYVDDYLQSSPDENTLIRYATETKDLCNEGGFKLEKYISNSEKVMQALDPEYVNEKILKAHINNDVLPVEKVLGVEWDMNEDLLQLSFNLETTEYDTRRKLLRLIAKIYDPIGIGAPFILHGRSLLQQACKIQLGWDDKLPENILNLTEKWVQEMKNKSIKLERNIIGSCSSLERAELHIFCDASETGYGAVAYLRIKEKEIINCSFLFGKARVAPLKGISIPRLELTAVVLGVRIKNMLLCNLCMNIETKFWTDSTTVIRYINNTSTRFQTFVSNILSIIRDNSDPRMWKYVPTDQNPADGASRGVQSKDWLVGPLYLWKNESEWPQSPIDLSDVSDLEIKEHKVFAAQAERDIILTLFNYYSSWFRLKKAVAWILELKNMHKENRGPKSLSVKNLDEAEAAIVNYIQKQEFSVEIGDLKTFGKVKKNSSLIKLQPFLDHDGNLRVGGRLKNAQIDLNEKHPLILPHKNHITSLIINHHHAMAGHLGLNYVLSQIRRKFWILGGNSAVRNELSKCIKCKKYQGKVVEQEMAELSKENLAFKEPPFTHVGIDCFGPFYVRRGRSEIKRYGLVLVCLTLRAVHIEVLENLDTNSFINGLRRFIARRGTVKTIRSDRGTNFCGGSRELKQKMKNLDHNKIGEEMSKGNVDWLFNPPYASHFGGIWERQIRSIRKVLISLLNEQTLTDDTLITLMCEVESIINNRPLSAVSTDQNDIVPLTPALLLNLKLTTNFIEEFDKTDCYKAKWKQVQYLSDLFWSRWKKEVLAELQLRNKWNIKKRNLEKGDVVLLKDEMRPRNRWPLALVTESPKSSDGLVHKVKLRSEGSEIIRPVSKIILLLENNN